MTLKDQLFDRRLKSDREKMILDSARQDAGRSISAAEYTAADIALQTIAVLQQWSMTDDLDAGETLADRLKGMLVGIADANHDGEITEDEQDVLDVALQAASNYLEGLGVDQADMQALLGDFDAAAAERVMDLMTASLPDGDDSDIDAFVFDDEEAVFDAVYKKKIAVRKGKKVIINKRISGVIKLSPKQKMAIKKALMKSHSAAAKVMRMKSMRVRKRLGL
jgi:hypothetical protein